MALDIWRKRWVGGVVLFLALAMLTCGETFLKGMLSPKTFLLYWLVCLVLTGTAIVIALEDLRTQRDRARTERRALLESTLKDIQEKAQAKDRNAKRQGEAKHPEERR